MFFIGSVAEVECLLDSVQTPLWNCTKWEVMNTRRLGRDQERYCACVSGDVDLITLDRFCRPVFGSNLWYLSRAVPKLGMYIRCVIMFAYAL